MGRIADVGPGAVTNRAARDGEGRRDAARETQRGTVLHQPTPRLPPPPQSPLPGQLATPTHAPHPCGRPSGSGRGARRHTTARPPGERLGLGPDAMPRIGAVGAAGRRGTRERKSKSKSKSKYGTVVSACMYRYANELEFYAMNYE